MTDLEQAAALHRQVAALATAADRAGVATDDLPAIRARLDAQQARFAEIGSGDDAPLPALVPTPSEVAIATPGLGDLSAASVAHAVRTMMSTLDSADAALGATSALVATATAPPPAPAPAPLPPPLPEKPAATPAPSSGGAGVWVRNGVVYFGFAASVTVTQYFLFLVFDETQLPALAPLCLLVLPAFSWLAGYATIGWAFPADPGKKVNRTPRLGAIINLGPLIFLLALVSILFLARVF